MPKWSRAISLSDYKKLIRKQRKVDRKALRRAADRTAQSVEVQREARNS